MSNTSNYTLASIVNRLEQIKGLIEAVSVVAVTVTINELPAGANNIGDVDVLTQPARAATADAITAKLATDCLQNGLTALTPKFALIAISSVGDNAVVAAVASKKIRVLAYVLTTDLGGNAKWRSATNDKTGLLYCGAKAMVAAAFNPVGWFETNAGEALNLNLSGPLAFGGHVIYVEV